MRFDSGVTIPEGLVSDPERKATTTRTVTKITLFLSIIFTCSTQEERIVLHLRG